MKQKSDLDRLSKRDTYSIATALLYLLKNSHKYEITSELFYLLDKDSFLNLIKYYGGKTIRIPSSDEISNVLKVILLFQYYKIEEMSWEDSLQMAGYDESESLSARSKLIRLERLLKTTNHDRKDYEGDRQD